MSFISLLELENTNKLNQMIAQLSNSNPNRNLELLFYQRQASLLNLKNYMSKLEGSSNSKNKQTTSYPTNAQPARDTKTNSKQGSNKQSDNRYKTELCRQFSENNGQCKYGDKCQFAHGTVDLKGIIRHPKYKTDFCKTFHSKGFCPYGPRCHFIHEFNDNTDILNKPISSSIQAAKSMNMDEIVKNQMNNSNQDNDQDENGSCFYSQDSGAFLNNSDCSSNSMNSIDHLNQSFASNQEMDNLGNQDVLSNLLFSLNILSPETIGMLTSTPARTRSSVSSISSYYSNSSTSNF